MYIFFNFQFTTYVGHLIIKAFFWLRKDLLYIYDSHSMNYGDFLTEEGLIKYMRVIQ